MSRERNRLLNNYRVLAKMQAKLPVAFDGLAGHIFEEQPDLSDEDLRGALEHHSMLDALEVGDPMSIRVNLDPQRDDGGNWMYRHEMKVPFQGSRELWKVRPNPHAQLYLSGRAAHGSVTLEDHCFEKEFESFERNQIYNLNQAKAALPLHAPEIAMFNADVPELVGLWIASRPDELAAWRERGIMMRERARKRQAFALSEERIAPVIVPKWKEYIRNLRDMQRTPTH